MKPDFPVCNIGNDLPLLIINVIMPGSVSYSQRKFHCIKGT